MSEESINENSVDTEISEICTSDCIFCNIIAANDSNIILEPRSDQFVVIRDARPVATHHYLVLSHKHIQSAKKLKPCEQDRNLLMSMVAAAKQVLINNGCDLNDIRMGFHWPPFYSISHMHLHVISPVRSMSIVHRYVAFNPRFSLVFVDVNYVRQRIGCEENDKIENQPQLKQSSV